MKQQSKYNDKIIFKTLEFIFKLYIKTDLKKTFLKYFLSSYKLLTRR